MKAVIKWMGDASFTGQADSRHTVAMDCSASMMLGKTPNITHDYEVIEVQ